MIRKLTYVFVAVCISLFAMHVANDATANLAKTESAWDTASQVGHQDQLSEAALTDFYISEVSPKQTAARPLNVSVPSPARTIQANGTVRTGSTQTGRTGSSNRTGALCGKSDISQKRICSVVSDNEARLLPFGFTDLSDHFLSLCKLII